MKNKLIIMIRKFGPWVENEVKVFFAFSYKTFLLFKAPAEGFNPAEHSLTLTNLS